MNLLITVIFTYNLERLHIIYSLQFWNCILYSLTIIS